MRKGLWQPSGLVGIHLGTQGNPRCYVEHVRDLFPLEPIKVNSYRRLQNPKFLSFNLSPISPNIYAKYMCGFPCGIPDIPRCHMFISFVLNSKYFKKRRVLLWLLGYTPYLRITMLCCLCLITTWLSHLLFPTPVCSFYYLWQFFSKY